MRAAAPAVSGYHGLALFRGGMIAAARAAMALSGVEGAVGGDAGDLLIGRNLVEQLGQHGRIADIAYGELGRPDFQRLRVNSDVDLARDTAFRAAHPCAFVGKTAPRTVF